MRYKIKSHHVDNETKESAVHIYVLLLICSPAHIVFMCAKPLLSAREESVAQTEIQSSTTSYPCDGGAKVSKLSARLLPAQCLPDV